MGLAHILKLAGKFVLRGFVFKAGKKAALRGGKVGIGAASLLAGGYMAYSLLQKREERQKSKNRIKKAEKANREKIVV
ncbi:hypothetical protein [Christiangramia sabulilitoris]|uniref:Uncharacterized protein n=1 Tax=Christiangramia sabulilitoris TaxID=2583991 RepID=A0A550I827_9FLAO|nr:hypothetical protein [Christiangramia sabulilitoris]TRO67130.1 hypothetical protein FGM01_04400 [Christiangramia sabulilitoris]